MHRLCLALLLLIPAALHAADDKPIAFRGAKILTAAGETFDPGTLVVASGKITAVGPVDEVDGKIPDGADVRDAAGKVIIPGLVDSHSHLGVYSRPSVSANSDGNEMTGPVQGLVRALDSLNPYDPGIRMANAGGVTTANVMPGSGNVIGGQTVYVKLRGYTPEQMWLENDGILGGLKMANGENPKRAYGRKNQAPGTRMKLAALQRSEFLKALDYKRKWDRYRQKLEEHQQAAERKGGSQPDDEKPDDEKPDDEKPENEPPTPPDRDLGLEPLVEVLEKKRTVHFHTHRADDILTALRLREEFGFDLVIQHGTEAYKVLDQIAAAGVPVSMTVVDSPGGKQEVVDLIEECGAELHRRGVKVHVNTDDPITESRFLLRTAATCVRGGLPEDAALRAITIHPAEALRIADRVGSLEAGKDADFVLLSGAPFSVYTRVLETYIDGQKVFDMTDDRQRLYQVGGFHLTNRELVPERQELIEPRSQPEAPRQPARAAKPTGESDEFVVLAGRVHTVADGTIEDGAVHVRDGKIVAVSPREDFEMPDGVRVLTAAAVTPGLIDAYSVVPLNGEYNIPADQDADEQSDPNQADVRVLDGFHPGEPLLRFLLEQGVTVVHACPGRANVIAGQTGVFRTHGRDAAAMTLRFPHAMLFNLGESPKETYEGKRPGTRMGTAALLRQALTSAANFDRKRKQAEDDPDKTPDRDLKLEALADVLAKKTKALFVAHRAEDLHTALRLIDEFKLDGGLAMATEGYLVADAIQKAGVPVILHPPMQRVGDLETINTHMGNAAVLADRKVPLAVCSGVEGYVPKTRVIRYEAAMAMVYGLGFERALRAITLDAAKILGIEKDHGSLEAGKAADLVLYDGDPFEHATHVTQVVSGGRVVYDRTKREPVPFARRWYLSAPEVPCCLW